MEKVPEWIRDWGNPSSIHWGGRKPKALLRQARQNLAKMLGTHPLELVFTSGGSEANNLAIKGVYFQLRRENPARNRYIFSTMEHPSIIKAAQFLANCGADVQYVSVGRDGQIDWAMYESLLSENTALVSIMLANNETGTIFPIKKLAARAHKVGALFHSDAVQAMGKIPLNLSSMGVDLATFSGHKFYALKGVGVLYVKRGVNLENLVHGGGQERGRRGGTENILSIASLGLMAGQSASILDKISQLGELRDRMETKILSEIEGVTITAKDSKRLPNTSSLVISGIDGETLLMSLDMKGFAVSTGAACSSGNPEPSPALLAMGLSREEAQSSLRVSLGYYTTWEELLKFTECLQSVVERLRRLNETNGKNKEDNLCLQN